MTNTKTKEAMLYDYAQDNVRKLVYHLSQAGSDGSAYNAALQILKTAVKDHNAGHDPGARYRNVNGRIVAAPMASSCPCEQEL
jgi:hypothetical protein